MFVAFPRWVFFVSRAATALSQRFIIKCRCNWPPSFLRCGLMSPRRSKECDESLTRHLTPLGTVLFQGIHTRRHEILGKWRALNYVHARVRLEDIVDLSCSPNFSNYNVRWRMRISVSCFGWWTFQIAYGENFEELASSTIFKRRGFLAKRYEGKLMKSSSFLYHLFFTE